MKAGGNIDYKTMAKEACPLYKKRTTPLVEALYSQYSKDVNKEKFDPEFKRIISEIRNTVFTGSDTCLSQLQAVVAGKSNLLSQALAKAHEEASKPVVVAVDQSDPEYKKAEAICTVSDRALMDTCKKKLSEQAPKIVIQAAGATQVASWNELRMNLMLDTGHIPEEGLSDVAKEELRELNRLAESDIIRDAGNQYVKLTAKGFREKIITRSEGSVEALDNILRNPSEPLRTADQKVSPFLVHYQKEGREQAEEVNNYFDAKEALRHRYGIPKNSLEFQYSVTGIDGVSPGGSSAKDDLSDKVNVQANIRRNTFLVSESGWLSVGAGLRFSEIKPQGDSIREHEPTHYMWAFGPSVAYHYAVSHPLAVFIGADLFLNKPTGSYLQGDGVMRDSLHLSSDIVGGLVVRDLLSGLKDAPNLDLVLSGGWRARYNPVKIKEESFTPDERASDPTLSEKQGYLTGGAAVGSAAIRWNFGK